MHHKGSIRSPRWYTVPYNHVLGPFVFVALAIFFTGCGGGGGSSSGSNSQTPSSPNPAPSISSVSPSSAIAGGAGFTLTVDGSNFISSSAIQWNGNNRSTTYISATQLTTSISTADIAMGQNAAITVVNPSPGGGTSAEVLLAVNTPAPTVASIAPSSVAAGGAGFTLAVAGSNFIPGSTVQWNGSYGQPPLATSYVSSTELTVAIPASDIAFAGNANVTVVSPPPAGGTSAAAVFTITGSIPSNVSFVAPNGNDSNSGTITQPYLTIQMCATTVSSGDICAIRAGTYREMVTPNSGITITSYDGEPVTVDGSDPVTGWTLYQGSIYEASVALSLSDGNQVFVGNQMMTEARWPNGNDLFHVNWATLGAGTTTTQLVDSNLPNINWAGANLIFWSGTDPWSFLTGTVAASGTGQLTFTLDSENYCPYICPTAGGYYFLSGVMGALDTANEWYCDSATSTLYFWAPGSVNPSTLSVTAKRRQYAFDLSNQSNVTIEYINVFASTINSNPSSANNTLDGINASYLSHYTTLVDSTNCPSAEYSDFWNVHTCDTGIILWGSGNVLEDSAIAYSAGDGVSLEGQNNTVKNNLIHHIDYVMNYASGISLAGTGQEVQNNTIYAAARIGIFANSIGSGATNSLDISYNNVFATMMLSRDAGAFYTTYDDATSAQVHNNWLHDTQSLVSGSADNYNLAGVYIDQFASGWEIDQNILWNNEYNNIVLHENPSDGAPSKNTDVQNNSVPDVSSTANISLTDIVSCGTTQIVNNLMFDQVTQSDGTACTATNNGATAPGATQMTPSVRVGCNFAGCSSEGPPTISGTSVAASIAVQPYNMTVTAGQPVTFTVTGAGSPTLTYQWQKNGSNITGATSASYTISAASAADNGAVFTVMVSNSLGSVTSNPATLTVQ